MSLEKQVISSDPSLMDLLDMFKKDVMLEINCHAIGTVQGFDPVKQTITATINYKKTLFKYNSKTKSFDATALDYPILVDVPLVILGGGTAHMTFPIAVGDECLILFNDRDIDNWYAGSNNSQVATARLHSFSDGIALVGVRSQANKLPAYDSNRARFYNGNTEVSVSQTKVRIKNDTKNLKTLLQSLITEIKAITVTCASAGNPSSTPINASALTSIATEIGDLLE